MSWIKTTKDLQKAFKPTKKQTSIKRINICCIAHCRNQPTSEFKIDIRGEEKIVFLCSIHQ